MHAEGTGATAGLSSSELNAASAKPDRRQKALQTVLLGTTVPFKQGGGAVFPNGYPGLGYRLDGEQFQRYRIELETALSSENLNWLVRGMRRIYLLSMLGLLLSFAAMNFLEKAPYFHNELDSLIPTVAVVLVVVLAVTVLVHLNNRVMGFARGFKRAPKVSRHAYLRQRLLGALIARNNGPWFLHLSAIVPLALATWFSQVGEISLQTLLAFAIVVLPLVLYAVWRLALLLTYWRCRLAHGRAPRPEDLVPL